MQRPGGKWHRHHTLVVAIIELDDGKIVSGGSEGRVVAWDPRDESFAILQRHRGGVEGLVKLKNGGWASGGHDGVIAWCGPDGHVQRRKLHSKKSVAL